MLKELNTDKSLRFFHFEMIVVFRRLSDVSYSTHLLNQILHIFTKENTWNKS